MIAENRTGGYHRFSVLNDTTEQSNISRNRQYLGISTEIFSANMLFCKKASKQIRL